MKTILNKRGFTLIEVLLILVILSGFLYINISYVQRRSETAMVDQTAGQMQQILNAGLAYYVSFGRWPTDLSSLSGESFIPNNFTSPWNQQYVAGVNSSYFFVQVDIPTTYANAAGIATLIAGRLPISKTAFGGSYYRVIAMVNVPGQNLNNATAMNYAGVYHHGACIPVPSCPPKDKKGNVLKPQVFVTPISISGLKDSGSSNAYPIASFSTYATGSTPLDTNPPLCSGQASVNYSGTASNSTNCNTGGISVASSAYWRACVRVVTSNGALDTNSGYWGQSVTVAAFTRCAISTGPEPEFTGSTLNVYGN